MSDKLFEIKNDSVRPLMFHPVAGQSTSLMLVPGKSAQVEERSLRAWLKSKAVRGWVERGALVLPKGFKLEEPAPVEAPKTDPAPPADLPADLSKMTVDEAEELIATVDDYATIERWWTAEQGADKPRSTLVRALEARGSALNKG